MSNLSNQIIEGIRKVAGQNICHCMNLDLMKLKNKILQKCIDTSYVSTVGEYVNTFEKNISDFTGANT